MATKLQEAVAAIKAGNKTTGQQILAEIVKRDPRNEQAWLWLAAAVESDEQRRHCLQNVLKINPDNQSARQGLAVLVQKVAVKKPEAFDQDEGYEVIDNDDVEEETDDSVASEANSTKKSAPPRKLRRLKTGVQSKVSPPVESPSQPAQSELAVQQQKVPPMSSAAALQKLASDRARGITPNLNKANLQGTDLGGADLSEASLHHVNLRQASLAGANLRHSNLSGADLTGVNLSQAKLNEAKLSKTNLTGANLQDANLNGAHLPGANLSGAQLHGANLGWADLRDATLNDVGYDDSTRWPDGFSPPPPGTGKVEDEARTETSVFIEGKIQNKPSTLVSQSTSRSSAKQQGNQHSKITNKLLNEDQDPEVVKKIYEEISSILTSEEEIIFIAVQNKPMMNTTPTSVVLTNRRLIVFSPKLLGGSEFKDFVWKDLQNAHMREGRRGATFEINTMSERRTLAIGHLPKKQARKLYTIAQEMEEYVREERRFRELEEKRAASGGMFVQESSVAPEKPTFSSFNDQESPIIETTPSVDQLKSQGSQIGERFLNEGQSPEVVQQVYARATELLTSNETILYIAVQSKPIVNFTPKSVVLTNRRFIIFSPKLLGGMNFRDYIWRDLKDAHIYEGIMGTKIQLKTVKGFPLTVDYLPKKQARKAYAIAQEMEEKVREERRKREIEDKRAASGGIYLPGTTPAVQQLEPSIFSGQEDPVQKLQQLKEMLDTELITPEEFEAKKAEILSNM